MSSLPAPRVNASAFPGSALWTGVNFNPTGFGEEARGFVRYLSRLGFAVKSLPLDRPGADPLNEIAHGDPTVLAELQAAIDRPANRPLTAIMHMVIGAQPQRVDGPVRCLARTMWETDRVWPGAVPGLNTLDEIWVASQFNVEGFRASGVTVPLHVVGSGVDADLFRPGVEPLELEGRRGTIFLSMFEWTFRKGWDVLLTAWARAFDASDDVTLVLRAYPQGRYANDAELDAAAEAMFGEGLERLGLERSKLAPVILLGRHLQSADVPRLVAAADCYVAPSRGEGWGRPMLEAMATGLPVIATNWGGNTEFMKPDNSLLLEIDGLVLVDERMNVSFHQGQRWAEPSVEHLVELLKTTAARPELRAQIGRRARADVEAQWTWEKVAGVAGTRLVELAERLPSPEDRRGGRSSGCARALPERRAPEVSLALVEDSEAMPVDSEAMTLDTPKRSPERTPATPKSAAVAQGASIPHFLVDGRELLLDQRLLATWAFAFDPKDRAVLIAYGPGLEGVEFEARLREMSTRIGRRLEELPRIEALLPPKETDEDRARLEALTLARLAAARPSPKSPSELLCIAPGDPAALRSLAAGGPTAARRRVNGPLVSVLVPVYNHKDYLQESVESILAQSYADLEILLVDDGSRDGSAELAERLCFLDERMVFIANEQNLGLVGNHRHCLKLATGEFVKFVHTDDRLRETAIERLVAMAVANPQASLVTSARRVIDEHGVIQAPFGPDVPLAEHDALFDGRAASTQLLITGANQIGEPTTVLFRRASLRPEEFSAYQGRSYTSLLDVATWFTLLSRGDLAFIAEPLSELRRHKAQAGEALGSVLQQREFLQLARDAHEVGFINAAEDLGAATRVAALRLVDSYFVELPSDHSSVVASLSSALSYFAEVLEGLRPDAGWSAEQTLVQAGSSSAS